MSKKLNLGCGNDMKTGYINLDMYALEGIDVVHDLTKFPYPFEDNHFDEVIAINVLEHLPDTIQTLREIWRIMKFGALLTVRVPYWNSIDSITDPTHIKLFNEKSFDFFDPSLRHFQNRSYYGYPTYKIENISYYILPLRMLGYQKVKNRFVKSLLHSVAHNLGNVIRVLEFDLRKIRL